MFTSHFKNIKILEECAYMKQFKVIYMQANDRSSLNETSGSV